MIPYDTKKLIYNNIPIQYQVKGETVQVAKRYANQFVAEIFPTVTIDYGPQSNLVFDYLNMYRCVTQKSTDKHRYRDGITKYTFDITPVDLIYLVTGIVGGEAYTFLTTEYQLVSNQIEFLGPNYPDVDSDFYATYHHQVVRQFLGGVYYDTLTIDSWGEDMRSNGTFINGIVLVDKIIKDLWELFYLNEMSENWTVVPGVLVSNLSSIRNLDETTGTEFRRRRQFDCWVRHVIEQEVDVESIETVNWEIKELKL